MKALDLTNRQFGRLTAKTPERRLKKRGWNCECSCGAKKWIITPQLTAGYTTSCGCIRIDKRNISGQRFGKLIAINEDHRDKKNGRWFWSCKCDCGNMINVTSRNLQRGSTVDCGCNVAERRRLIGLKRRRPQVERIMRKKFSMYKSNARIGKREFSISLDDAIRVFSSDCFYCGRCASGDDINGIDRANNLLGYTKDNSIPCCSACNFLKNDWNLDELMEWVSRVYKRHFP